MYLSITSKKIRATITFSRPGKAYIFADINGQDGCLGRQICTGGHVTGSTISYFGEDQGEFDRICRRWYKQFVAQWEDGDPLL